MREWYFKTWHTPDLTVCCQLLSVFDAREAVAILQNVLEVQEVNWQLVLSFTAALLVYFPDAPALLQGIVSNKNIFISGKKSIHTHTWPLKGKYVPCFYS